MELLTNLTLLLKTGDPILKGCNGISKQTTNRRLCCSADVEYIAPDKPTDRSFTELVKLVGDHYSPIPSVIVKCFRFNTCICQPRESVATFIAELRHLTRYCEFGDSLKDMLCGRLVYGIDNGPMWRKLLAEPALSWDKGVEIALGMDLQSGMQEIYKSLSIHKL